MFAGITDKFQPPLWEMYRNIGFLFADPKDAWVYINPFGNALETAAVLLAVVGILLQARHNIWGWICMAIAAMFLPYFLYRNYGLLGDSLLWFILFIWFTATGIWGWAHWIRERAKIHARDKGDIHSFKYMVKKSHMADLTFYPEFEEDYIKNKVNGLDWFQCLLLIPAIFTLTIAFAWITTILLPNLAERSEDLYFQVALPYWDALTTVTACFAQFLLIRKYWQAWGLWGLVGFLSIAIYAYKGAWTFVLMHIVVLVIATISIFDWFSKYRNQKQAQNA